MQSKMNGIGKARASLALATRSSRMGSLGSTKTGWKPILHCFPAHCQGLREPTVERPSSDVG
jgi:hypothetical protein